MRVISSNCADMVEEDSLCLNEGFQDMVSKSKKKKIKKQAKLSNSVEVVASKFPKGIRHRPLSK